MTFETFETGGEETSLEEDLRLRSLGEFMLPSHEEGEGEELIMEGLGKLSARGGSEAMGKGKEREREGSITEDKSEKLSNIGLSIMARGSLGIVPLGGSNPLSSATLCRQNCKMSSESKGKTSSMLGEPRV